MSKEKNFEEETEIFFQAFTSDGERICVRDILEAAPQSGLQVTEPALLRALALLDEGGVAELTLSDLNTLFAIRDPLSEEDRMAVFIDPENELPSEISFAEFVESSN